jgi:hypothetical protein
VAVSEQALQGGQVGPGFEEVCGVTVPQGMAGDRLCQPRRFPSSQNGSLQSGDVERTARWTGEEPVGWSMLQPVSPQVGEKFVVEGHTTVLATLAMPHPENVTSGIDVSDAKVKNLAGSQSAAVSNAEHESVAARWDSVE